MLAGYLAVTKNYVCWHNSTMTEKALDSAMMFYGSNNSNSSDATVFTKVAYRDVLELDDEYEGQTGHIVITTRTSKVNAVYSVLISLIARGFTVTKVAG